MLSGAMTQENVELLYRAYNAFNRRDLDASIKQVLEAFIRRDCEAPPSFYLADR
jgi:hypothetical protein